ncbi:MAG: CatB-related O-acetyltransferase [Rhodobacteraceae bacterium]|nr:CatB-related O-acetyltransferase [Paracoccaceae bacterium]
MTILEWGEGTALRIGAFCSIADGVTVLLGGNHRIDWISTFPFGHIHLEELGGEGIVGHPQSRGDVVIGNDVWIGQGATILSGVTIADGAVVGAGAVVARDIGPYEIWGGNPAVLLRPRFPAPVIEALLALKWWDLPEARLKEAAAILSGPPTPERLEQLKAWAKAGG